MRRYSLWALIVVLMAPLIWAQEKEEPAEQDASTPAQQYAQLVRDHRTALNAFMAEYRKATNAEERRKLLSESYPQPAKYAAKFLELAQQNPDAAVATQALGWILTNASGTPESEAAGKSLLERAAKNPEDPKSLDQLILVATRMRGKLGDEAGSKLLKMASDKQDDPAVFDALASLVSRGQGDLADKAATWLLENQVDNEKLGMICLRTMYSRSESVQDWLRKVVDKSTNATVKGSASYALAKSMLRSNSKNTDQVEQLLESVVQDYGDLKVGRRTLRQMAEGDLFELRNLQIGMTAPDITGEDVDGEAFKLSDYRGKVVVLDFWGDW